MNAYVASGSSVIAGYAGIGKSCLRCSAVSNSCAAKSLLKQTLTSTLTHLMYGSNVMIFMKFNKNSLLTGVHLLFVVSHLKKSAPGQFAVALQSLS